MNFQLINQFKSTNKLIFAVKIKQYYFKFYYLIFSEFIYESPKIQILFLIFTFKLKLIKNMHLKKSKTKLFKRVNFYFRQDN